MVEKLIKIDLFASAIPRVVANKLEEDVMEMSKICSRYSSVTVNFDSIWINLCIRLSIIIRVHTIAVYRY